MHTMSHKSGNPPPTKKSPRKDSRTSEKLPSKLMGYMTARFLHQESGTPTGFLPKRLDITNPTNERVELNKMDEERAERRLEAQLQPQSRASSQSRSRRGSFGSTHQTLTSSLAPLQTKEAADDATLEPLAEEEIVPGSFELVAPAQHDTGPSSHALERRAEQIFSKEHMQTIFEDPELLSQFANFMCSMRPASVPLLVYYLDALKALKAIDYANAIVEALEPLDGHKFTHTQAAATVNGDLRHKADAAFQELTNQELPAFVTQIWIQIVSTSIRKRITGTLPTDLREMSDGLAEVFCVSDPSRADNPIVFASEEFHRTTQYGVNHAIGRNCRFLQGPKTSPYSVQRLREKVAAGREHHETFLNYRRDGSPFMNLLMCAPLFDNHGKVRYFVGAQVDVSGLAKNCIGLEGMQKLMDREEGVENPADLADAASKEDDSTKRDEFRELCGMFNDRELETVKRSGGRIHRLQYKEVRDTEETPRVNHSMRVIIEDEQGPGEQYTDPGTAGHLSGIYENYLLVRPCHNLNILFASRSLRLPGILQSPFLSRIGGSSRVRDELEKAFARGTGVTARVKWITRYDPSGRWRWIHCTPLLGVNGAIGVWMVVLVDDEPDFQYRSQRVAPPIRAGNWASSRSPSIASVRSAEGVILEHNTRGDDRMLHAKRSGSHSTMAPPREGLFKDSAFEFTPPASPYAVMHKRSIVRDMGR